MDELKIKKDFTNVYTQETPYEYLNQMRKLWYRIPDVTKPMYDSLTEQLYNKLHRPVNILDLGSSYGISSALMTYNLRMSDLDKFFLKADRPPPKEVVKCFFENQPIKNSHFVFNQIDISLPALKFSEDVGLCKSSVCINLETGNPKLPEEFFPIDMIIATGCVGYIGYRSFSKLFEIIHEYWEKQQVKPETPAITPVIAFSILRIFDIEKIQKTFEHYGFTIQKSDVSPIAQRQFYNEEEENKTLDLLHEKGIRTKNLEDEGCLFADFYVGSPRQEEKLLTTMIRRMEKN